MNWLIALAAFAGIMAVFSTVVTVAVEAFHKALSLRRSGLQEMLRSMHTRVITRLDAGLPADDEKSVRKISSRFANVMTQSPSFGGQGRWWWPANWGLNISQRRLEHLSKRQLAEQLAQTDFGKRLIRADRVTIQRALTELAYEFDRIGVAQSTYFKARAKMLSGVFAFAFVAIGNINAIEIYQHLANNEATAGRTINFVEAVLSEEMRSQPPTAGTEKQAVSEYLDSIEKVQAQTRLPVGRAYFPFCEGLVLPGEPAPRRIDPRCRDTQAKLTLAIPFTDWAVNLPSAVSEAFRSPGNWLIWLLSIIATAGLLGLGAPFWFDVFNKASSLVGRQVVQAKTAAAAEDAKACQPSLPAKRGGEDANAPEMTDSFLIAGGQAHRAVCNGDVAPVGLRIGAASRETTGSSQSPPTPGPTGSSGIRRPPGAVKGR
jgi:hypothetical protein